MVHPLPVQAANSAKEPWVPASSWPSRPDACSGAVDDTGALIRFQPTLRVRVTVCVWPVAEVAVALGEADAVAVAVGLGVLVLVAVADGVGVLVKPGVALAVDVAVG